MFATVEVFEDDFHDGAHCRVRWTMAYDLIQRAIDHDFPIPTEFAGSKTGDVQKVHAILMDQLQL
jgi:hypothetical protein